MSTTYQVLIHFADFQGISKEMIGWVKLAIINNITFLLLVQNLNHLPLKEDTKRLIKHGHCVKSNPRALNCHMKMMVVKLLLQKSTSEFQKV